MIAERIIIHCSATKNGVSVSANVIRKFHMEENGWSDIGYHLTIDVDGTLEMGRPLNEIGAHCRGENHNSIGICLIGTDRFSSAQFMALYYELKTLHQCFDIPPWRIYCHNQFKSAIEQGKTCPGFEIGELLAWYCGGYWDGIKRYLLD